jgi:hypothetical protein
MLGNLSDEEPKEPATRDNLRALHKAALLAFGLAGGSGALSCGQVERTPTESKTGPNLPRVVATRSQGSAPQASDAAPRVSLARLEPDGSLSPIAGRYIDAVGFRHGQAAVTGDRELHLVTGDGSPSLLARQLDGLPTRAADGSLVYAARFAEVVEVYWLTPDGTNHRLASFRGSATRLAPQTKRTVIFVGAKLGGVSGAWLADAQGAHCLTNCSLRVGQPWGAEYRPPPADTASMRIVDKQVSWQTADGAWESVPWEDNL